MTEISGHFYRCADLQIWAVRISYGFWTKSVDPENSADLRLQADTSPVRTSLFLVCPKALIPVLMFNSCWYHCNITVLHCNCSVISSSWYSCHVTHYTMQTIKNVTFYFWL